MARKFIFEVKGHEGETLDFFTNIEKATVKAVSYVSQDGNEVSTKKRGPYDWSINSSYLTATIQKHILF